MTLPQEIEATALLGWRIYPCSRTTRHACFKGATDLASFDLNTLARWAREFPKCNWRVVMEGSGIWALDVDAPGPDHGADGITAFKELIAENSPLPDRPTTRSGGGGLALFFRHSGEPINGKTGYPRPGIDPRRGRLTVTIPPSVHITTGRAYKWLAAPWETPIPSAPTWLLKAVAPPPEPPRPAMPRIATADRAYRTLCRALDRIASAGEGGRNDTLNRASYNVARHVAAGLLGENEAVEALYAAAMQTGLHHLEARATIKSAFASGFRRPVETVWHAT